MRRGRVETKRLVPVEQAADCDSTWNTSHRCGLKLGGSCAGQSGEWSEPLRVCLYHRENSQPKFPRHPIKKDYALTATRSYQSPASYNALSISRLTVNQLNSFSCDDEDSLGAYDSSSRADS